MKFIYFFLINATADNEEATVVEKRYQDIGEKVLNLVLLEI